MHCFVPQIDAEIDDILGKHVTQQVVMVSTQAIFSLFQAFGYDRDKLAFVGCSLQPAQTLV